MDFKGKRCPKCGRKGLHYADNPHAIGYKDYENAACRFCKKIFSVEKLTAFYEKQT